MGQGVEIEDGCIVNTNPATGEILSRVKCTVPEEVDLLVERANEAQKFWLRTPYTERIALLKTGIEIIHTKSDTLTKWMIQEMGKPLTEAKEEMEDAIDKEKFMELLATSLKPQRFGTSTIVRDPFGVVAILSPWNFPVDEILLLALPALASGNTVIVKPSEVVPETGACLVSSLQSILPPGVLSLAQGDGEVGSQLVSHPNIHMVAMTGSSATGKHILQSAAPQLKRMVLEMGGKDPMVVFGDADLEKAAKDAVQYSLCNTGQVCCSIERIYVADSAYCEFQELVKEYATEYKVGSGMDPTNNIGPMVSMVLRDEVKQQVEDAISKGARILHQSVIPENSEKASFFPVTVLADVTEDMELFTKETFGPVVAMTKFDGSEEEALRLANKTEYGLGSCVYTKDMEKAQRVASLIGAGQVGINCYALEAMDVNCPWVGHKSSGFGYHSGIDGFHQFSIPKTIVISE